jgi:hypothetical protein
MVVGATINLAIANVFFRSMGQFVKRKSAPVILSPLAKMVLHVPIL